MSEKMSQVVLCPLCDKGMIETIFYPETKRDNMTTTVGGRRFRAFKLTRERYEVNERCPVCDASPDKIERVLNSGKDYKKPSRDKILERMKKAGLPTKV